MSHYSTLGYFQNPIIDTYRESFLVKIQTLWQQNISVDIPPPDFLLFPDIHGMLLAAIRPENPDKVAILALLQKQHLSYIDNENAFIYNQEEIIPWTNISLTLDFHNLDVENHAHPDHKKNHVGVGFDSKLPVEWRELFIKSFDILHQVSPWFMSEINQIIRKIIPFGVSYNVHNSGSYSDVIGHLLMSYPTWVQHPELALLEAILHEYNHNKLNLIMQTERLVLNDLSEAYYSPYRPDARHILGIYLGIHAIAWAYWVILNAHVSGIITLPIGWLEKSVLYVLKNWLSLQVLDKYAKLSPLGKEILEEMRNVHSECLALIKKANLHPEVIKGAKSSLMNHYFEVQKNYPNVLS